MLLNDFTKFRRCVVFPPEFMKCEFQTLMPHNHLSFLFLYITPNAGSIHPTYHHGVSMVTGLTHLLFFFFFSFQARWSCCAGIWHLALGVVSYKYKWHDRQSAVKTESVRRRLTHELDPKFIRCSIHEQKACEKGREWGKKRGKRKRESDSYNAVGPLSYSEFTLGSHTWCKWTIKLGLTWLSLPRGPGNDLSQPAMLGVLFCTLWIPTVALDEGRKKRALGSQGSWRKLTEAFIHSSIMFLMCPFCTWPCGHDSNCSLCLQASQYLQDGPHACSLHTHTHSHSRGTGAPPPQSSCWGSR